MHQRTMLAKRAEMDLSIAVNDVVRKYDLTYIELFQILTTITQSWLKYALREERHPDDPDKGGDEA